MKLLSGANFGGEFLFEENVAHSFYSIDSYEFINLDIVYLFASLSETPPFWVVFLFSANFYGVVVVYPTDIVPY